MLRVFQYEGTVDEAYREAARQSLAEAGWNPVMEIDGAQWLTCAGPDRGTCNLSQSFAFAIIAQR